MVVVEVVVLEGSSVMVGTEVVVVAVELVLV